MATFVHVEQNTSTSPVRAYVLGALPCWAGFSARRTSMSGACFVARHRYAASSTQYRPVPTGGDVPSRAAASTKCSQRTIEGVEYGARRGVRRPGPVCDSPSELARAHVA